MTLRVMMSAQQSPRLSPYVSTLAEHLSEQCEVMWFDWAQLLIGRPDVLHVHWPEAFARGSHWFKAIAKALLFSVYLALPRRHRAALVWTVHNLQPHETGTWFERATVRRFERKVDIRIYLNQSTENDLSARHRVALHPLLTLPLPRTYPMPAVDGDQLRLLYFGLVRPYKKVSELIGAFLAIGLGDATLRVVGEAEPIYAAELEALAARDRAVDLRLDRLSDEDLAMEIHACAICVVPGTNVYNSGATLLSLGMMRPVLTPRSPSSTALQHEFGTQWVHLYDGPIDARVVRAAIDDLRQMRLPNSGPPIPPPHNPARSWGWTTEQHLVAYRDALAVAGAGRESR